MITIGIDFGTTNSSAAVWMPQGTRIIDMPDGRDSMPSVVAISPKGPITGRAALRQYHENATYAFRHVKRYLGRKFTDEIHSHQMTAGPDGDIWWVGPDRLYSGPELVAEILKSLLTAAEYATGERPESAVLTMPVGFLEPQKLAMAKAAELAGLKSWEFDPEPVAAARAYGMDDGEFRRLLVYDWGGGTFDVSIVYTGKDGFGERKHGGLSDVGGADIDQLIVQHLSRILAEQGNDVSTKPQNMARLSIASEDAKIGLSQAEDYRILLDHFLTLNSGIADFDYTLTQEQLEELALELVKATIDECRSVLDQAGLRKNEIHHVILVGGQTRMPLVHDAIERHFGKKPLAGQKPEHVVALGAAMKGAEIDGRKEKTSLSRISTATLGVRRDNGLLFPLIAKGRKLPEQRAFDLTTMVDGQEVCSVQVFEGEHSQALFNAPVVDWAEPVEIAPAGCVTVPCVIGRDEKGAIWLTVNGRQVYPEVAE